MNAEFMRGPVAAGFCAMSYAQFRALDHRNQGPPSITVGRMRLWHIEALRSWLLAKTPNRGVINV